MAILPVERVEIMSKKRWSKGNLGRRMFAFGIGEPPRTEIPYAQCIRNAASDEFHKLVGRTNPAVRVNWRQAKYKFVTKLMRYAHRAEGVWS